MSKFRVFYDTTMWVEGGGEPEPIGGADEIELDVPESFSDSAKYQYVKHHFIKRQKLCCNATREVTGIEEI